MKKRSFSIKDPGSAITHFIALILALLGIAPLLLKAAREPDMLHVISMAVFILSMVLLYAASTIYHTLDTVSYTHLDVYKRQAAGRPEICFCCLRGDQIQQL